MKMRERSGAFVDCSRVLRDLPRTCSMSSSFCASAEMGERRTEDCLGLQTICLSGGWPMHILAVAAITAFS